MHNPFAPVTPNLFAVGLRDDMLWQRGNLDFSPYVRLFVSFEEAENYRGDSVMELFEYYVTDPDAVVRQQEHRWAHIKAQ